MSFSAKSGAGARASMDTVRKTPETKAARAEAFAAHGKEQRIAGRCVPMTGKVYLIGAGPGDSDLLTAQALRLLRTAEVVLHDDLVSPEILELIPAWTQVLNVGKQCGRAGMSQEKIHGLVIAAAREGRQVVRLKAADPLIFGRGDEEMEALREAGVDFEVVPGVTSASGAAAAAR